MVMPNLKWETTFSLVTVPVPKITKQAVEWYEKAVANDIPLAMLRMGEYYLYDYDKLNESEKAFSYFKKAAEAECYNEGLGICYEMGIGVEDNETEAFKYYTLAAGSGNVMSMYRTGLCYYNGVGVKQNYTEAYRWLMMPPEMTMWFVLLFR